MDELIKRSAAIIALSFSDRTGGMKCGDLKDVLEILQDLPAVDAVPVAWLKEKLTGHPELSYAVTDAIQNVLDLWEAEHE